MKKILDWKSHKVVSIFNEVTLWSSPFGRLLLENIPMQSGATIADIGFGTGFPLLELSQRFGEKSKIYGIDIWEEAIQIVKDKIDLLGLKNIEIIQESASKISIADGKIDLVTSNLGINNFEDKEAVYREIRRILKSEGRLCITTNPIGTFQELFDLFEVVLKSMQLEEELGKLKDAVGHRGTKESIISEFEAKGFELLLLKSDATAMRFTDAAALFDHSLIRIGFREHWEKMIRIARRKAFFEQLIEEIDKIIERDGEFKITIPLLYLEFQKKGGIQE